MKRRGRDRDLDALAVLWQEVYTDHALAYPPGGDHAERAAVAFSAATGLEVLGVGGSRAVFALDNRRVLKLPFNDGSVCNQVEEETWCWTPRRRRRWLAPVLEVGHYGSWLVMARARALSPRLERAVAAGKFDVVAAAFNVIDVDFAHNWGMIRHRLVIIDYGYVRDEAASEGVEAHPPVYPS